MPNSHLYAKTTSVYHTGLISHYREIIILRLKNTESVKRSENKTLEIEVHIHQLEFHFLQTY